jgi:probable rRNA maturation factor
MHSRVEITGAAPLPKTRVASFAGDVLEKLGKNNWLLSIFFCGDSFMRNLNRQFRGNDAATDILSFESGETRRGIFYAGDIVISVDTLKRNAQSFSCSLDEELRRLIIHGILHLDGLDHETNDESEPMLRLQEELLGAILWV